MMNADDIKKGIECMKAQKKSLEKEMLDLKTHLVRGIYDMGSEELIMVANRIAYLEKRIEAGIWNTPQPFIQRLTAEPSAYGTKHFS